MTKASLITGESYNSMSEKRPKKKEGGGGEKLLDLSQLPAGKGVVTSNSSSQRPPKGHRQRGAGTVIVSKPPVLTDDGI